jgi:hypothetical protein
MMFLACNSLMQSPSMIYIQRSGIGNAGPKPSTIAQ